MSKGQDLPRAHSKHVGTGVKTTAVFPAKLPLGATPGANDVQALPPLAQSIYDSGPPIRVLYLYRNRLVELDVCPKQG